MTTLIRMQWGWTLLFILTLISLINDICVKNTSTWFKVEPASSYAQSNIPIAKYGEYAIYPSGRLEIRNINFWQKFLAPKHEDPDIIQCVFILTYLSFIMFSLFLFDTKKFFGNQVSKKIKLLGYWILAYGICNSLRFKYLNNKVLDLTEHNFQIERASHQAIYIVACIYVLFMIAKVFEKGSWLQKENDLTV